MEKFLLAAQRQGRTAASHTETVDEGGIRTRSTQCFACILDNELLRFSGRFRADGLCGSASDYDGSKTLTLKTGTAPARRCPVPENRRPKAGNS